jgi:hypothetical protein
VATVEVSQAQRSAWDRMLEEADRGDAELPVVPPGESTQTDWNGLVSPMQLESEDDSGDEVDRSGMSGGVSIGSDDEIEPQPPAFEGKSFLSYS